MRRLAAEYEETLDFNSAFKDFVKVLDHAMMSGAPRIVWTSTYPNHALVVVVGLTDSSTRLRTSINTVQIAYRNIDLQG